MLFATLLVLNVTFLLGCTSDKSPMTLSGSKNNLAGETSDSTVTTEILSMNLPRFVYPQSVALAANSFLKINDRSKILSENGYAAVASSGTNGVEIGSDAISGSIVSVGNVFMRDNAKVFGSVHTSGEITHQNIWTISEDDVSQVGIDLTPFVTLQMKAEFPVNVSEYVNLEPDTENVTLAPGDYAQINVKSRATLTLQPGVYTTRQFTVEPDANIIIDDQNGPVILMVKDHCQFKGKLESLGYDIPNWMIVYAGTNTVFLEKPFAGTVFAPRASLVLASTSSGHQGSFFANNIEVHQATAVSIGPAVATSTLWKTACSQLSVNDDSDATDFCNDYKPKPASSENKTLTFQIPAGVNADQIALGASNSLQLGNNITINSTDGVIPVLTAANGQTTLGTGNTLGTIVSVGDITVAGSATLSGDLLTEGQINPGGSISVGGTTNDNAQLTPLNTIDFNSGFVDNTDGDIALQPGRSKILPIGDYDTVTVESGAKLYLYSGEYSFRTLVLKSGSTTIVEGFHGQTSLYVRDVLELNGTISHLGKGVLPDSEQLTTNLFVAYFGEATLTPSSTFSGLLAAPNATLELGTGAPATFTGAYFANNIVVRDNVSLVAIAAEVMNLSDASLENAVNDSFLGESVELTATDNYQNDGSNCDTVLTEGFVEFIIPQVLMVTTGNAGNHDATITAITSTSEEVVCTYRGGASTDHPVTMMDKAKGLEYAFVSCSGGHQPKETLVGNNFELCIEGDSLSTFGDATMASTTLDKKCNGVMPPIMSRGQAAQMRAAFSWETAPELQENNVLGKPALYYMNIFVADQAQIDMLDALLIHWDTMPFFVDELGRIENLCGTLDSGELYYNDMHGKWVYAIVPGPVYKAIRDAYFSDDIIDDERILFDAMVVRDYQAATPEIQGQLFDAVGSLRYETLGANGFLYMGLPELPDDAALDEIMQVDASKVAKKLVSAFEKVREGVRAAARLVTKAIGKLNTRIFGTVKVNVDVNITNIDPVFPPYAQSTPTDAPQAHEKLQIGWGPNGGRELAPGYLKVNLYKTTPIGFIANYPGKLNMWGKETLKVADVGGGGWMVLDYESGAAKISTGTGTDRWFINYSSLSKIKGDAGWNINTSNDNFMIMAEIGNGFKYNKQIIGYKPAKAKVLRGLHALILGNQLMAPTLSRSHAITDIVANLIPGFADDFYLGILATDDINVPNKSLHINGGKAMGVITHEYGHYTTFSMMMDYGINPLRMDSLLLSYLGEQIGGVQQDEDTNIIAESLADFYASQLVSGANYFIFRNSQWKLPEAIEHRHKMAFCRGRECADVNNTNPINRNEEQRMLVELLHDAVDFDWASKQSMHPSNADAWERRYTPAKDATPVQLEFSPNFYGDIDDEDVAIGGGGFRRVMKHMAHEGTIGNPFTKAILKDALAKEVKGYSFDGHWAEYWDAPERGYKGLLHNWCDACDLFVLHEAQVPNTATIEDDNFPGARFQRFRWEQCQALDVISDRIGPAPHPDLRMDADCEVCPPHERSVFHATTGDVHCQPCTGVNEVLVGNDCIECEWWEKPVGDECVPCPPGEHFTHATQRCESCPAGTGWNPAPSVQSCEPCQIDVYQTMDNSWPLCGTRYLNASDYASSGDNCPNEFWLEVDDFSRFLLALPHPAGTVMVADALAEGNESQEVCENTHVYKQLFVPNNSGGWVLSGENDAQNNWFYNVVTDQYYCQDSSTGPAVDKSKIIGGLNSTRIRLLCDEDGTPTDCVAKLNFGFCLVE